VQVDDDVSGRRVVDLMPLGEIGDGQLFQREVVGELHGVASLASVRLSPEREFPLAREARISGS
jgi:hypothetical protein